MAVGTAGTFSGARPAERRVSVCCGVVIFTMLEEINGRFLLTKMCIVEKLVHYNKHESQDFQDLNTPFSRNLQKQLQAQ